MVLTKGGKLKLRGTQMNKRYAPPNAIMGECNENFWKSEEWYLAHFGGLWKHHNIGLVLANKLRCLFRNTCSSEVTVAMVKSCFVLLFAKNSNGSHKGAEFSIDVLLVREVK